MEVGHVQVNGGAVNPGYYNKVGTRSALSEQDAENFVE